MKGVDSTPIRRVLICDDNPGQYSLLSDYLMKEGYQCDDRIDTFEDLRSRIAESYNSRLWYSFIMIDIDLSGGRETYNGVECYTQLATEFPSETYLIYTSQDIQPIRREINRLLYRDVELVLLDKIINREDIRFYLKRLIQERDHNRVFVVHGRNGNKTNKIKKLLEKGFGLEVVTWENARDQVRSPRNTIFDIVLAGIEMSACTLVLFTDDEEVELRPEFRSGADFEITRGPHGERKRQARPNVYIEAGYAFGKRPNRTVFVEWPDQPEVFESPSDLGGYYFIRYADTSKHREELRRSLENARCHLHLANKWRSMKL